MGVMHFDANGVPLSDLRLQELGLDAFPIPDPSDDPGVRVVGFFEHGSSLHIEPRPYLRGTDIEVSEAMPRLIPRPVAALIEDVSHCLGSMAHLARCLWSCSWLNTFATGLDAVGRSVLDLVAMEREQLRAAAGLKPPPPPAPPVKRFPRDPGGATTR